MSNKFQESNQEPINNNNLTSHRSLENSTSTTNRSNFEKEFDNGDLVDENPDPSSICHRLLFKVIAILINNGVFEFKKIQNIFYITKYSFKIGLFYKLERL